MQNLKPIRPSDIKSRKNNVKVVSKKCYRYV